MDKKSIRKEMLTYLKTTEKYNHEIKLMKQLFNLPEWNNAETIGITLSMPHEIDTFSIIKFAQVQGKKVYVPNCHYKNKTMDFVRFNELEDLFIDEKGIQAVKEPHEINNDLDLVIVPGLAYSREGFRIGYGGGYYDRFLSQYRGNTISLALSGQIRTIEPDHFDIPVQKIITEKEIIIGKSNDTQ